MLEDWSQAPHTGHHRGLPPPSSDGFVPRPHLMDHLERVEGLHDVMKSIVKANHGKSFINISTVQS